MGTTLTALALVGGAGGRDVLTLANVGDSRAYVFSGGHPVQVTDDHSLAEERMRHGEMTEAEAAVHPQRHILTPGLSRVSSEVEADMWELELHAGDRVLVCSDGLSNEVGIDEMAEILRTGRDPTSRRPGGRPGGQRARRRGQLRSSAAACRWAEGRAGDRYRRRSRPSDSAAVAAVAPPRQPWRLPPPAALPSGVAGSPADSATIGAESESTGVVATASVPMDDTWLPGHASASVTQPTSLAGEGPRSDEFFMGTATSAPVALLELRGSSPCSMRTTGPSQKESRGARRRRLGSHDASPPV